ncbi:MAG: lysophospholipase [Candidatus Omnitrophica bacterium]|nr:lysophospholipase [Candidatus Omnitrophota bacterium]
MHRREGTLTGIGGIALHHWVQTVEAPRGSCLIVHGVGEHSGRYLHVAQALNLQCRLTAWALDYRGHGRSGGRRGHCGTFQELICDVNSVITHMRSQTPDGPLFLLGHSLGGLIALTYALQNGSRLSGVVASSPALALSVQPPLIKRLLAQTVGRILPTLAVKNDVNPSVLSHDPTVVGDYRTDPLVHHDITLHSYLETVRTMAWTRSHAGQMAIPCLILQAGDDRVVSRQASQAFAQAVRSPGSRSKVYDRFYHEIFNETGRAEVLNDLCRWLNERLNGAPA